MPQQHKLTVQKTAHYQTLGSLSKETKEIWIACHGYAQTADYMADKMSVLDDGRRFIICPEGLHQFYWEKTNEAVSTWMTKRHRYDAIEDNVQYLSALYDRYCRHVHQDTKIHLFAFSQGCATVWRWLHAVQPRVDSLINWAGWIPEDIGYKHLSEYFQNIDLYLHYGDQDQWITAETLSKITDVIRDNQLDIHVSSFKGKHHIPKEELKSFVSACY